MICPIMSSYEQGIQSWKRKCPAQGIGIYLLGSVASLKKFQQKSDTSGQICDLEVPSKCFVDYGWDGNEHEKLNLVEMRLS